MIVQLKSVDISCKMYTCVVVWGHQSTSLSSDHDLTIGSYTTDLGWAGT